MWNHILGYVNHVLLSAVPSANFLVYCLVGNKFRWERGGGYTTTTVSKMGILLHYKINWGVLAYKGESYPHSPCSRRIASLYLRRAAHISPATRRTFQLRPGSLRSSVKTTGTGVGGSSPPVT